MHDVIIIGGGPAGLSAALNGAAEGLSTLLLERDSVLGGQAGTSSRIENYLGFPGGVPGKPLTKKAVQQARRLGADMRTDHAVVRVEHNPATDFWLTECERGTQHVSRAVILASGVDYKRLDPAIDPQGRAIYGAPAAAHEECAGHPVVVIGGGNSAGQAALNLARLGAEVTLIVRRPLKFTMSHYLIERIAQHGGVVPVLGEARLVIPSDEHGTVVFTDEKVRYPAHRLFAYIGMMPRTDFIDHCCSTKPPGFVETDDNFAANENGLFVAGDVRAGSFKRVAAAVGEGAIAAAAAWRYIYSD